MLRLGETVTMDDSLVSDNGIYRLDISESERATQETNLISSSASDAI